MSNLTSRMAALDSFPVLDASTTEVLYGLTSAAVMMTSARYGVTRDVAEDYVTLAYVHAAQLVADGLPAQDASRLGAYRAVNDARQDLGTSAGHGVDSLDEMAEYDGFDVEESASLWSPVASPTDAIAQTSMRDMAAEAFDALTEDEQVIVSLVATRHGDKRDEWKNGAPNPAPVAEHLGVNMNNGSKMVAVKRTITNAIDALRTNVDYIRSHEMGRHQDSRAGVWTETTVETSTSQVSHPGGQFGNRPNYESRAGVLVTWHADGTTTATIGEHASPVSPLRAVMLSRKSPIVNRFRPDGATRDADRWAEAITPSGAVAKAARAKSKRGGSVGTSMTMTTRSPWQGKTTRV